MLSAVKVKVNCVTRDCDSSRVIVYIEQKKKWVDMVHLTKGYRAPRDVVDVRINVVGRKVGKEETGTV